MKTKTTTTTTAAATAKKKIHFRFRNDHHQHSFFHTSLIWWNITLCTMHTHVMKEKKIIYPRHTMYSICVCLYLSPSLSWFFFSSLFLYIFWFLALPLLRFILFSLCYYSKQPVNDSFGLRGNIELFTDVAASSFSMCVFCIVSRPFYYYMTVERFSFLSLSLGRSFFIITFVPMQRFVLLIFLTELVPLSTEIYDEILEYKQ